MTLMGQVGVSEGAMLELDPRDAIDAPPVIGTDERRMHVRAYNYWVSLLNGRAFPAVDDIDVAHNQDFGPHSVLIDFTAGMDAPSIAYLGEAIRLECGLPAQVESLSEVPARSLLSRLTDHHMQIIANKAPVGFEAEFVNERGVNTAYRGILMPFSTDDDTIDFIYGVINWKHVVPLPELEALQAQVSAELARTPASSGVPAWQDGPHAAANVAEAAPDEEEKRVHPEEADGLADWLAHARDSADSLKTADSRSRAALYVALGHAYDFALVTAERPDEYRELLADAGLKAQDRAPMTPVVKLVFGADYDKTRLTEFAAALSYGKRNGLPRGGMRLFLEKYPGGLKAIVGAERRERRPSEAATKPDPTREAARAMKPQTLLTLPGEDEFIVLVARRLDKDHVAVIGVAPDDKPLIDRALRHIVTSET